MTNSLIPARHGILELDADTGHIVDAPGSIILSTQYIDSHPFMSRAGGLTPKLVSEGFGYIAAGPYAYKIGQNDWMGVDVPGEDYVLYRIVGEANGAYMLTRVR